MDTLKTLMDKKQYELVIKATENATESTHLFYRIAAFLALGKAEESLKCLLDNRHILEKELPVLIRIHIEILCILNRFDEAYEEMKYYENLPYHSQPVEELLQSMPKYIREEEKRHFNSHEMDDQQVKKLLRSSEMNDVIIALDIVKSRGYQNFLEDLKWLMVNHPLQSIRSFSLLVLVQNEVNGIFKFQHIEKLIEVNPSKIKPPFVGEPFNTITKRITVEFNNPSLSDNAIQILSTYIMYIYPDDIDASIEEIIEALYQVSSSYLHAEIEPLEGRCKKKNLDINKINELINNIKFALENF